jgi:hypothetical protein
MRRIPSLEYPDWQNPVFSAILEPDFSKLDQRRQVAIAATLQSLLRLIAEPSPAESAALAEAIRVLRDR